AVGVDGLGNHPSGTFEVGDVVVVGDGLSAALADEVDGQVRVPAATLALDRDAEVVDDHLGAVLGQLQRVPAADAVTGPRDDRNLAVEHAHGSSRLRGSEFLTGRQILGA